MAGPFIKIQGNDAKEAPVKKAGRFVQVTSEEQAYTVQNDLDRTFAVGGAPTLVPKTRRNGATVDGMKYGALRLGHTVRVLEDGTQEVLGDIPDDFHLYLNHTRLEVERMKASSSSMNLFRERRPEGDMNTEFGRQARGMLDMLEDGGEDEDTPLRVETVRNEIVEETPGHKAARETARGIFRERTNAIAEGAAEDDTPKPTPRKKAGPHMLQVIDEAIDRHNEQDKLLQNTVRATLKGPFGTFKGVYNSVERQGDLLVLVYPIDASVFAPPWEEDEKKAKFTVSCEGQDYPVYSMDVQIELLPLRLGLQIFAIDE